MEGAELLVTTIPQVDRYTILSPDTLMMKAPYVIKSSMYPMS